MAFTAASGIILAGGRSSRMGRDKSQLEMDGNTLLDRVVKVVADLADDVHIVGHGHIRDDFPNAGPLGGLLTGLRRARHPTSIVVACDLPFLNGALLAYLHSLLEGHDAVVPRVEGRPEPLHAVYRTAIIPAVERLLRDGSLSMQSLVSRVDVRWVDENETDCFDPARLSFKNVNTPLDWEEALELAHAAAGTLEGPR